MISYSHDRAWREELNSCVEITANYLKDLGLGETKELPKVLAADIQDNGSDFYRLIEVFFDEARFEAELSFAAETEGNKVLAYQDHARKKETKEANKRRFSLVLDDAIIFCGLSKDLGMVFKESILNILNDSFPHMGFLFELYETVMFRTRCQLLEKRRAITIKSK